MKFTPLIITILSCLGSALAMAEPSAIITYESLDTRVTKNNPELAAARFRIDEAIALASQSGLLSNPSFDSGISHNTQSAEGAIEIGLTQKFPVTNRLSLEREIGLKHIKAAEAEVRNVERLLIAEARASFVRILSIRDRQTLLNRQKKIAEELVSFISDASERGEISPLDAAQSRLTALRFTTDERKLATEETAELGKLRPIIGLSPDTQVTLSGTAPRIVFPTTSDTERPDLAAEKIKLLAAEQAIALEEARRREDVQASAFLAAERTNDAPEGLENETIVGFKLSIPLPLWNKNQGNIDAATARRNRQEQEIHALARDIHHETETAKTEMRQWASMVRELDDELLPLAKQQTDLLEQSYRNGQGDLQSVLRSREESLELEATRLEAIREYQLARIRYQAATGKL